MRITNKVMAQDYLYNLSTNLQEMQRQQNELSSGHQVQKPSDDPFKVSRTMELTASIAANERYSTNIDEGIGWTDTTDAALAQIGDALKTVKEKTIAGGDGTYSTDERKAIATQMQQLKEQIAQIGNTCYDGRYVFGGEKTTEPPFNIDKTTGAVTYQGSSTGIIKEMSQGVTMDVAVTGNSFSNEPGTPASEGKLFQTLTNIINKLNNNQNPTDELDNLENETNNILRLRAEVGAKQNRLSDMQDKNGTENYNMTDLLSKTYDIDVAKVVMESKVMENVYNASLQTGAKILQPSILDFLR